MSDIEQVILIMAGIVFTLLLFTYLALPRIVVNFGG